MHYLIGSPEHLSERAKAILDNEPVVTVTGVVLAEIAYVLRSVYEVPREEIVDSLVDLLQKQNMRIHGAPKDITIAGLLLCRPSGRVSFADALLWAAARSAGNDAVFFSFDARFPSAGIVLKQG